MRRIRKDRVFEIVGGKPPAHGQCEEAKQERPQETLEGMVKLGDAYRSSISRSQKCHNTKAVKGGSQQAPHTAHSKPVEGMKVRGNVREEGKTYEEQ